MKNTSDYKIINIVNEFKEKSFKDKDTFFNFLLRLKQSLEFNSTINWDALYKSLSDSYKNQRPFYTNGSYTAENIDPTTFPSNAVFVFGSNDQGQHIGGAAFFAKEKFGAIDGQAIGLVGQSYAIPTLYFDKDNALQKIDLLDIKDSIQELIHFALDHGDLEFHVTKIGCGIAGFEIREIASLFKGLIIPENIILPQEFVNPQMFEEYVYNPIRKKFFHIKSVNKVIAVSTEPGKFGITETTLEGVAFHLGNECVECDREDFISASEQVLKSLY